MKLQWTKFVALAVAAILMAGCGMFSGQERMIETSEPSRPAPDPITGARPTPAGSPSGQQ